MSTYDNNRTAKAPLLKRPIEPVTFTVEITATKMNEHGTLLGFEVKSIKSSKVKSLAVSLPPRLGGGMFIKVEDPNDPGITVLDAPEKGEKVTKKFF